MDGPSNLTNLGTEKTQRPLSLVKDGLASRQPRSPPSKAVRKVSIQISKEQNPRLSDGPNPLRPPPTSAPGSRPAKGQKGEAGLGVGGEVLPQSPPASVCAQGGGPSLLGASTHPSTAAVLSAQRGHGSLGQAGSPPQL